MGKDKIHLKIFKKTVALIGEFNDVLANKLMYRVYTGKKLNLKNPTSFNEKLMKLKLADYNNNELVSKCADKYMVQEYVKECGLEKILNPIIAVYEKAEDIDFAKLPDKFVLKCNHGCGYNIVCTNKDELDKKKTVKTLNKWLKEKFGRETRELHYLKIKPLIICETFIENKNGVLPDDYKIYCFNGEPKLILRCSEREGHKLKANFFDLNWNEVNYGYEKNRKDGNISKPECLEEMLECARILSKPFKFVRADFYELNGQPLFGELTFTPARCCGTRYNDEGSKYLSGMLDVSDLK